jgi:hypothetical protein
MYELLDRNHTNERIYTPAETLASTAGLIDDGCYLCGDIQGLTPITGTGDVICNECWEKGARESDTRGR